MTQVAVEAPGGAVSAVLPPSFRAVHQARRVVRSALTDWAADRIVDDVALVVSELVANALQHGLRLSVEGELPPETDEPDLDDRRVELQLVSTGSYLICAVRDPSPEPPVRRPANESAVGGRGLQLIETLSRSWGWTPAAGAKSVWAIFSLAESFAERAHADRAPSREPVASLRAG